MIVAFLLTPLVFALNSGIITPTRLNGPEGFWCGEPSFGSCNNTVQVNLKHFNPYSPTTTFGPVPSPTGSVSLLQRLFGRFNQPIRVPVDPTKEEPAVLVSTSYKPTATVEITSTLTAPPATRTLTSSVIKPEDCGKFIVLSNGERSQVVSIAGFYESDTPETFSNIPTTVLRQLGVFERSAVTLDYTLSLDFNSIQESSNSTTGC